MNTLHYHDDNECCSTSLNIVSNSQNTSVDSTNMKLGKEMNPLTRPGEREREMRDKYHTCSLAIRSWPLSEIIVCMTVLLAICSGSGCVWNKDH